MTREERRALQVHIHELEELVEAMLVHARSGNQEARERLVHVHREVMNKRHRLKDLSGRDG